MLALTGIGLMLAFAASPAITGGPLTAGDFRYTARQIAVCRWSPSAFWAACRCCPCARSSILAAVTFACALIGSFLVLFVGADVLGARRELDLGGFRPAAVGIPQAQLRHSGRGGAGRPPAAVPFPSRWSPSCCWRRRWSSCCCSPMSARPACCSALWGAMLFFCGHVASSGWAPASALPAVLGVVAYEIFPACPSPRGAVPQRIRHRLSGRAGAEGLRPWRPRRRGSRRGHHQISHPRCPFRLHLRGGGRGVRLSAVRPDRACCSAC